MHVKMPASQKPGLQPVPTQFAVLLLLHPHDDVRLFSTQLTNGCLYWRGLEHVFEKFPFRVKNETNK